MRKDKLIIHCSATKPSMNVTPKDIWKWHVEERGFSDYGYHYMIDRDGKIHPGRPLAKKGAHGKGYNDCPGICLLGGMSEDGKDAANFTFHQYLELNRLIGTLMDRAFLNRDADIIGHCDLPGVTKTCPCFDVKSLFG